MKFTQLFTKTNKKAKEFDSINATLLIKGGFIDQTMAGVYTYLPLGLRVLTKIENIVRSEMDKVAPEILMPSLAPKALWETTGRLETVDVLMKTLAANPAALAKNDAEYVLNCTHEEVITPIAQKFALSYRDLPFAAYQIQTKFRNEPRVKSGLMRGREFRMKDLYSFHRSEAELKEFYELMKARYTDVFQKLGLGNDTYLTLASGGDFTKDYSHEFQTRCDSGEDTIYLDKETGIYYNKEVAPAYIDSEKFEVFAAAEVGNIFPLNTKFSQACNYQFVDQNGNHQPVYMGSYGIGTSRIMGLIVEKMNDQDGILWPIQVAPFQIHLLTLGDTNAEVEPLYHQLQAAGIEVLWDDRSVSAGEKFSDADLIGCPIRLVYSSKTDGQFEWKMRGESATENLSLDSVIKRTQELVTTAYHT